MNPSNISKDEVRMLVSAWDIPALELPDKAEEIWPVKPITTPQKTDKKQTLSRSDSPRSVPACGR
jgi:hypothetical protein